MNARRGKYQLEDAVNDDDTSTLFKDVPTKRTDWQVDGRFHSWRPKTIAEVKRNHRAESLLQLFVPLCRPLPLLVSPVRICMAQFGLKFLQLLHYLELTVQFRHVQCRPTGRVHLEHADARLQQTLNALTMSTGRGQMEGRITRAVRSGEISAALQQNGQGEGLSTDRC
uniref:Uncharacterized protein n=1 Tax=Anopheles farauti TaxID=69004 RepID=A0A182QDM8_9DIPT